MLLPFLQKFSLQLGQAFFPELPLLLLGKSVRNEVIVQVRKVRRFCNELDAEFSQVTASSSLPNFPNNKEVEDANQVAAPNESRTPNWHRAKIAQLRVRMEGWRQRRLSWTEEIVEQKNVEKSKKFLTGIGLLMEGTGPQSHGQMVGIVSGSTPVYS